VGSPGLVAPIPSTGGVGGGAGPSRRTSAPAVGRDLPDVPPRISNRRSSVAVRHVSRSLDRFSACGNCSLVGLVRILDIDVEAGRHRLPLAAAVADHDDRIANPHLRRRSGLELAVGAEHDLHKPDKAGDSVGEGSGSHVVPAIRLDRVHGLPPAAEPGRAISASTRVFDALWRYPGYLLIDQSVMGITDALPGLPVQL